MKLSVLVEGYCVVTSSEDVVITSLASHTDNVREGCLFFALDGTSLDGTKYIIEAAAKGASAIITSVRVEDCSVMQIVVDNPRRVMSELASRFYMHPAKDITLIGITGTNGKTTVTYMVRAILEELGKRVAIIGTNGTYIGSRHIATALTTPDPIDLYRILVECQREGVKYVVMEVSAHAIYLDKIHGLVFDIVAFNNLSQDHLDFFETMDRYKTAKLKLFDSRYAKCAVVNVDDKVGREIVDSGKLNCVTYGYEMPSDIFALNLSMTPSGNTYIINCKDNVGKVKCCLPGKFNMYNSLCAIGIAVQLGLPLKGIIKGIMRVGSIDGRFNIINTATFSVVIDFAHSEDSLANIIRTIKEFAMGRVITVFGCGGNRDRDKRPKMGMVAAEYSDYVVVTSDNPRDESPEQIIEQITTGIQGDNYTAIIDRREAISYAVDIACKDDIIIIAGKGAEKYQEIQGVKYDYNDEEYVLSLIDNK